MFRTLPGAPGHNCSSATQRVAVCPSQHGRLLVVCRASQASRSSSPRVPDGLRNSWRTELQQIGRSNGNGNGLHADAEHHTAYSSSSSSSNGNGNGYGHGHEQADDWAHAGTSYADQQRESDEADHAWYADSWRGDHSPGTASWASDVEEDDDADRVASAYTAEAPEAAEEDEDGDGAEGGTSLFTDAFKDALKQALQRSPLYGNSFGGSGSDNEEDVPPQPTENEVETMDRPIFTDQFRSVLKASLERQQTELDKYGGYGSDDEYTPTPYVPAAPLRREMSPMEELLSSALGASQLNLRRLNLMAKEIEAAIERETKQVERLAFALGKVQSDEAYYKSLERMLEERQAQGGR